jgi:hypothetical protein
VREFESQVVVVVVAEEEFTKREKNIQTNKRL